MTDTGPPYPPAPVAGSNAIGSFEIGVSAIGDIPAFVFWSTIISQYANSPILTGIIAAWDAAIDQTQNLENFFDDIWNVNTATGYGLDVWGRIVGVQRNLNVQGASWFGFAEAGPGVAGWNQEAFYSGQPLTSVYSLTDQAFRTLILAKAFANISSGSIPDINTLLMTLFPGEGNAYVTDGYQNAPYFGFAEAANACGWNQAPFYSGESIARMMMTYTFDFQLTPVQLAIVQSSGVLPRPAGVSASIVINA